MKRYQIFAVLALAAFAATAAVSCGNRGGSGKNQQDSSSADVAQAQAAAVPDTIAPLVPGEVRLKDDVFGEEIALKGDTVKRDEIFQVGVSTMIVKDSLMLVCCRDDRPFRMYSLPGLELRGVSGNRGRGPMEFISPDIWPYGAPGYMALVMDESRDYRKMYKVRTDGTLEQLNHRIPGQYLADFSYTRGVAAEDDGHIAFAYRSAIYLYDGSDTAAAPEQTVRKLADVRLGKYSAGSTMTEGVGMDSNVTHYWKLYAGHRYVWLLYSGRTPVDVVREQNKDIYYIYVEQFDWNGNPVRRYRLDNWGFISVDEDSGTLYFLSNVSEYPFFKYSLR